VFDRDESDVSLAFVRSELVCRLTTFQVIILMLDPSHSCCSVLCDMLSSDVGG
jgi:hypothetical protein